MNWKFKSIIQNSVAYLPEKLSHRIYFRIKRHLGKLRKIDPTPKIVHARETFVRLKDKGFKPEGGVFLEVGTGWGVTVPLVYWLMGANRVITVDLNRYLNDELVREILEFLVDNQNKIEKMLEDLIDEERYVELIDLAKTDYSISDVLELCGIEYHAPADASELNIESGSINFHTSYTVFEHIPAQILHDILSEARRLICDSGCLLHRIDYSDHFSHRDKNISSVNFLQFSQRQWNLYAGNRFMYMNRLRHSDYISIFKDSSLRVLSEDTSLDESALALIEKGLLRIHEDFSKKSFKDLATTSSWICATKVL